MPIVGVHPFPLPELFLMSAAVCRLRPTHVFERATHVGKSARVFYETTAYCGLAIEIHPVDLPPEVDHQEHPGQRRGELVRDIPSVTLHLGDGLHLALECIRLHQVARPLVFVDGDHAYESVARELAGIMERRHRHRFSCTTRSISRRTLSVTWGLIGQSWKRSRACRDAIASWKAPPAYSA